MDMQLVLFTTRTGSDTGFIGSEIDKVTADILFLIETSLIMASFFFPQTKMLGRMNLKIDEITINVSCSIRKSTTTKA